MIRRRRRRPARAQTAPWTAEEDDKLRDMVECGLASEHWRLGLPGRPFGDVSARILDLGLQKAPLV